MVRIYTTIFPSLQIAKAGPSHPRSPERERTIEESDSDSDLIESPPKKLRLVSDLPESKFLESYMVVSNVKTKKRKIPVVLPKKDKPEWLAEVGEVSFKQDLWDLEIPDILIAHVAGSLAGKPKEFSVSSDASLLSESFSLISCKLNAPPSFIRMRMQYIYDQIKHLIKSLTYQWATALKLHREEVKNQVWLEQVVYPGVAEAVVALEKTVRQSRHMALSNKIPKVLRFRFINAPIDKLWPEDDKLLDDIRKFFRDLRIKAFRTGNFRGNSKRSRGSGFRGFSFRSFQRGHRPRRSRGQRGRGNATNSATSSQPTNSS